MFSLRLSGGLSHSAMMILTVEVSENASLETCLSSGKTDSSEGSHHLPSMSVGCRRGSNSNASPRMKVDGSPALDCRVLEIQSVAC